MAVDVIVPDPWVDGPRLDRDLGLSRHRPPVRARFGRHRMAGWRILGFEPVPTSGESRGRA